MLLWTSSWGQWGSGQTEILSQRTTDQESDEDTDEDPYDTHCVEHILPVEASAENYIRRSDSVFTNPQSARTSVTLSIRLLNGSWLPVQGVLDSGATISCGSVYHHGLGHPLQTDDHKGTLLTDANGRRIPIAGFVNLDVQIEMEGVGDPVIIKNMRVYLIRNKQMEKLITWL